MNKIKKTLIAILSCLTVAFTATGLSACDMLSNFGEEGGNVSTYYGLSPEDIIALVDAWGYDIDVDALAKNLQTQGKFSYDEIQEWKNRNKNENNGNGNEKRIYIATVYINGDGDLIVILKDRTEINIGSLLEGLPEIPSASEEESSERPEIPEEPSESEREPESSEDWVPVEPESSENTGSSESTEKPEIPENPNIPSNAISFNGHKYLLIQKSMKWADAEAYCESLGGHLVTITSAAEEEFLYQAYNSRTVWLGGFDKGNDTWAWITGETWSYNNWRDGEPNNAAEYGEDLIEASLGYDWNDIYNYDGDGNYCELEFICEWDEYKVVARPNLDVTIKPDEVPESQVVYFNGHKYALIEKYLNWYDAEEYCESLGGHLVTVTSIEENAFIQQQFLTRRGDLWLGAFDKNKSAHGLNGSKWTWVTGEAWAYNNWREGEPSGGEYYLRYEGAYWNDMSYDCETAFVCEWDEYTVVERPSDEPIIPDEPEYSDGIPTEKIIFNGRTYQYVSMTANWADAEAYCESLGGHLMTITTQEESNFLYSTFGNNGDLWVWLGGFDKGNDNWAWVTGEKWSDEFWGSSGEPNGGDSENYLHIYGNRWNDIDGNSLFAFICEWDNLPVVERPSDVVIPEDSEDSDYSEEIEQPTGETFVITSVADYYTLMNGYNQISAFEYKKVELACDLYGLTITPIYHFSGEFNGNGHTISVARVLLGKDNSNYYVRVNNTGYTNFQGVGLFAFSKYGTVKNLNLEMNVSVETDRPLFLGGIFGAGGEIEIENCTVNVNATVSCSGDVCVVGGLVGGAYSDSVSIKNTTVNSTITCVAANDNGVDTYIGGAIGHGCSQMKECKVTVACRAATNGDLFAGTICGANSSSVNAKYEYCDLWGAIEYKVNAGATVLTGEILGKGNKYRNEVTVHQADAVARELTQEEMEMIPESYWKYFA